MADMENKKMQMLGGGYYNRHSSLQEMAIDKSFAVFEPTQFEGQTITLADYGCSEGRNSVHMLSKFLSGVPSVSSAILVFNDTPSNDFSSLSATIDAQWSTLSQNRKLGIYPLLVPQSFYGQVLPDDFVHVGFCFTSLHWLSKVPDSLEASLFTEYAQDDLSAFISARHKEIRRGGSLLLGIPMNGPVSTKPVINCLEKVLNTLSSKYSIDVSLTKRLPLYWRTMDEITAAVGVGKGKWRVVSTAEVPMAHSAISLLEGLPAADEAEEPSENEIEYAAAMTGFALAALEGFVVADFKSRAQEGEGVTSTRQSELRKDLTTEFQEEFTRSYRRQAVGFTYAFVQLEKL